MAARKPLVWNNRLEQLQDEDAIDLSLIAYGNKRPYIGSAPYPYVLVKGNIWIELDSNDDFVEQWIWNGNYWLSKQEYSIDQFSENFVAGPLQKTVSLSPNPSGSNRSIFLTSLNQFITCNVSPASLSTAWVWSIRAIANSGFTTLSVGNNNIGQPAGIPKLYSTTLGTQLTYDPVNRHSLTLTENRNGSTILKRGHLWANYRKIRG
jgi:hypothetical protein